MAKPLLGLMVYICSGALVAPAQAADPAYASLDRAYAALRAKDYELAIQGF